MMPSIVRPLLLVALLVSPLFATATAVIDGPNEARVGDLVVLSGGNSKGDGFRWILPERIQAITCNDGLDLAFATGTPGTYQFILIAADKEASISYVAHDVVVSGSLPTEPGPDPPPKPEPDPDKPDDPTPPPEQFESLRKLSELAAKDLNDPATARSLAAAMRAADAKLDAMCDAGRCPGLVQAKEMMVLAIQESLARREGRSRQVNWLDGWRTIVSDAIKKINPPDVPTYQLCMRAAATGLEAAN